MTIEFDLEENELDFEWGIAKVPPTQFVRCEVPSGRGAHWRSTCGRYKFVERMLDGVPKYAVKAYSKVFSTNLKGVALMSIQDAIENYYQTKRAGDSVKVFESAPNMPEIIESDLKT